MKKVISFLLGICVTLCCVIPAKASALGEEDTISSVRQYVEVRTEDLRSAVEDYYSRMYGAINDDMIVESFDFSNAYELYRVQEYIVKMYSAENSLSGQIKNASKVWVIPVDFPKEASGIITLSETQDGFEVLGISRFDNGQRELFSYDRFEEIIQTALISPSEISGFRIVRNMQYNTEFIWFLTKGEEYIIPLDEVLAEADISANKVYSVKDFVAKIDKYYDEATDEALRKEAFEKGEYLYGGGVVARMSAENHSNQLAAIIIANVMLLLLLTGASLLWKKKKRTD